MRTKLFTMLLVVFSLSMFTCSNDAVEMVDDSRSPMIERPWKSKASGTFQMVEPTVCTDGLMQFAIEGMGNATHLGKFEVNLTNCTNLSDIQFISGSATAANGDFINFLSVGAGLDDLGTYTEYMINGGSGRFEYATGLVRLYDEIEFTSPTGGIFTNQGIGTITY